MYTHVNPCLKMEIFKRESFFLKNENKKDIMENSTPILTFNINLESINTSFLIFTRALVRPDIVYPRGRWSTNRH
jgi:hypothetical protein